MESRLRLRRRHWLAWMAMCGALAVHVADEALTGWLDWYNPTVSAIYEQYPFPLLPIILPTFTFEIFLSLLIFAVVSLTAASWFVKKGRWAMRPISHVFAAVMFSNAIFHIGHSIYMGKLMPGVYTSPLLLAASVLLIAYTRAYQRWRG